VAQLTLLPGYEDQDPFTSQIYWMSDGIRMKIGYSERPPKRRGGELKTEVIYTMPGDMAAERAEHKRWSASRIGISREWFEATRVMLVWLALRIDPAADPRGAGALEWLARNLDRQDGQLAA
jgi:hypothetical protein